MADDEKQFSNSSNNNSNKASPPSPPPITVTSYSSRPGLYAELTYRETAGNVKTFLLPYTAGISVNCQQEVFTPVKGFFDQLNRLLNQLASKNFIAAAAKAAADIALLAVTYFGGNVSGPGYTAKAWKDGSHVSLNLKFDFYWGMKEKGNAKEEVYNPIFSIFQYTIPKKAGPLYAGQAPSGVDVFVLYGKSFFSGNSSASAKKFEKELKESQAEVEASVGKPDISEGNKLWSVSWGYSKDGKTMESRFLTIKNLICTGSSYSFDTNVLDEKGYPMNGSLSLNFETQLIYLVDDLPTRG